MPRLVLLAAVLALAGIAFGAGWWLREHRAIDACRQVEGQWSPDGPAGGYCHGSRFGATEV